MHHARSATPSDIIALGHGATLAAVVPVAPKPISFLLDEMMPASVGMVIEDRGHRFEWSRKVLRAQAPDEHVADAANRMRSVLITMNKKDFDKLAGRRPQGGNHQRFRHLSMVYMRCDYAQCATRLRDLFALVEFEIRHVETLPDDRAFIEIGPSLVRILR